MKGKFKLCLVITLIFALIFSFMNFNFSYAETEGNIIFTGIEPINVTASPNSIPILPVKVTAIYSDDSTQVLNVVWEPIEPSTYENPGTFTVDGIAEGDIEVSATVNVVTPNISTGNVNPLFDNIFNADPSTLTYRNSFYIYAGHDEAPADYSNYVMNDWHIFSSTDMDNWNDNGSAMNYEVFDWAYGDAWTGQCIEKNGKFYWYVPVNDDNSLPGSGWMAIGVAVSDSPLGPWKDAKGTWLINDSTKNSSLLNIDPTVFIDTDGQAYIYWGSYNSLRMAKLNDDMISLDGDVQIPEGVVDFWEAPYINKIKDKYYLSYSSGENPATIEYCISDSPMGPWTYMGRINDATSSPTNHSAIQEFRGQYYFAYHNSDISGDQYRRSIAVDRIYVNDDGTLKKVVQTTSGVPAAPVDNNLSYIASANASSFLESGSILALNDGYTPENSSDKSHDIFMVESGNQWVEYSFSSPQNINTLELYFYDDDSSYKVPLSYTIQYFNGSSYVNIQPIGGSGTDKDKYNKTTFNTVETSKIRIQLASNNASNMGIMEWKLYYDATIPSASPSPSQNPSSQPSTIPSSITSVTPASESPSLSVSTTPSTTPSISPSTTPSEKAPTTTSPYTVPEEAAGLYDEIINKGNDIQNEPDIEKAQDEALGLITKIAPDLKVLYQKGVSGKAVEQAIEQTLNIVLSKAATIKITPTVDNNTEKILIDDTIATELEEQINTISQLSKEMNDELLSQELDIYIPPILKINTDTTNKNITKADVQLPNSLLLSSKEKNIGHIEIGTSVLSIKLPLNAIPDIETNDVTLSASKLETDNLSSTLKSAIGNSPAYNLEASVGNKKISKFNSMLEIAIPYEPDELDDISKITIFYIDSDGNLINMLGNFDQNTNTVNFKTDHFSTYIIKTNVITFKDTESVKWAEKYIETMASKGIINGMGAGIFDPLSNCTRAQFVLMITKAVGIYDDTATSSYSDIQETDWYYKGISSASKYGIINGYPDGTFAPNKNITREDMAVVIANVLKNVKGKTGKAEESYLLNFKDNNLVSDYAQQSVSLLVKNEIMNGYLDKTFAPKRLTNRAEASAVIYKLFYFN